MLRRFILAAACVLLSVQLGTADEKTKGKISIWLGYPETLDAFKLGQAEFKKKWPNVDVEILTFELREFEAKLAVSVPAGSGPDILALHDFIFPRYYEGGNLADVPGDLAKDINDPKIIDPVFKDILTRDGKPWGMHERWTRKPDGKFVASVPFQFIALDEKHDLTPKLNEDDREFAKLWGKKVPKAFSVDDLKLPPSLLQ